MNLPETHDARLLEKARNVRLLALDVDGVLTDGSLYFDQNGNELKAFNTRDGLGIKALQRFGIRTAIITGRSSPVVEQRAKELSIDMVYQGQSDKNACLDRLLNETRLSEEEICYAGDDWVDLPVLGRVGLAVTVADADPLVKSRVHWVTERGGGQGAVREICNLILAAQGHDETLLRELLSP